MDSQRHSGVVAIARRNHGPPRLNQSMKLDWPEKIVMGLAILIMASMFLFWVVLADGVGSMHDNRLNIAVFRWFIDMELAFILPIWILLRMINLVSKSYLSWRSRR